MTITEITTFLTKIADAIRYAEGSTGSIPARQFKTRIRALKPIATSNLVNVIYDIPSWITKSNTSSTATKGSSYSCTLSLNSGYSSSNINSISIYMGADDITSSAYNDETMTISISNVTGVISVVVEEKTTETVKVYYTIPSWMTKSTGTSTTETITKGSKYTCTFYLNGHSTSEISSEYATMNGNTYSVVSGSLSIEPVTHNIYVTITEVNSSSSSSSGNSSSGSSSSGSSSSESSTDTSTYSISNPRMVTDSSNTMTRLTGDNKKTTTWDCVWFGSYPQKEIVSSASSFTAYKGNTSQLNASHDYIADSTLYNALKSLTYTNGVATYNGTKYYRLQSSDARNTNPSGEGYEWDSTQYHYFKSTPIKWRVLNVNGSNATLVADEVLDCYPYYSSSPSSYSWSTSDVRTWLNGTMYNKMFTSTEQASIISTSVNNADSTSNSCMTDSTTTDKVRLLSVAESRSTTYGFNNADNDYSNSKPVENCRRARSTTFARAMGVITHANGHGFNWLRSISNSHLGCYSCSVGNIVAGYDPITSLIKGVRPMVNVNISKGTLKYAGVVKSNIVDNSANEVNGSVIGIVSGGSQSGDSSSGIVDNTQQSTSTSSTIGATSTYSQLTSSTTKVTASSSSLESDAVTRTSFITEGSNYVLRNKWVYASPVNQYPYVWAKQSSPPSYDTAKATNVNCLNVSGGLSKPLIVENCVFENTNGIHFGGLTNGITVRNCIFKNTEHGIYFANCSNATVENCTFEHNTTGLYCYYQTFYFCGGNSNITVNNCKITSGNDLRYSFRTGTSTTDSSGNSIVDSTKYNRNIRVNNCEIEGGFASFYKSLSLNEVDIKFTNCKYTFKTLGNVPSTLAGIQGTNSKIHESNGGKSTASISIVFDNCDFINTTSKTLYKTNGGTTGSTPTFINGCTFTGTIS